MPTPRHLIALVVLIGTVVGGCDSESSRARNVILISIDTLRADRLGAYGHDAPTSPNLDLLAAQGVVFEDTSSTSPWTIPSHASLLTGLYPSGHGVQTLGLRLSNKIPSLATVLGENGYDTAAFVNVVFLGGGSGLNQGFDKFGITGPKTSRQGVSKDMIQEIKSWLSAHRERPVFVFAHFFDVHSSYQSLPHFEAMFTHGEENRFDGSTKQIVKAATGATPPVTPSEAAHLMRLYDAGIRQLDDELGRFFGWLRDKQWLDDTVVIITSDHGEEFLEHGGMLHSSSHYEELVRVPLIISGAGIDVSGRVSTPVSIVDVAPTLLTLLDIQPTAEFDGRDLSPFLKNPDASVPSLENRTLVVETGPAMTDVLRTARRGRHKLILNLKSGNRELYDLVADPLETENLVYKKPDLADSLAAELEEISGRGAGFEEAPPISPEMKQRLEALGYLVPGT